MLIKDPEISIGKGSQYGLIRHWLTPFNIRKTLSWLSLLQIDQSFIHLLSNYSFASLSVNAVESLNASYI